MLSLPEAAQGLHSCLEAVFGPQGEKGQCGDALVAPLCLCHADRAVCPPI